MSVVIREVFYTSKKTVPVSKKFFVAGIVLYPDIYLCFDTFVLPKEVKKAVKNLEVKKKVVPLQSRSGNGVRD